MTPFSIYLFDEDSDLPLNKCQRQDYKKPLLVNCMGRFITKTKINIKNKAGRNDIYLLYVNSGRLKIRLSDNGEVLTKGSFIIIPERTPYSYYTDEGSEIDYFWVHFTGAEAVSLVEKMGFSLYPRANRKTPDTATEILFNNMFDSYYITTALRDAEIAVQLFSLLRHLSASSNGERDGGRLKKSLSFIRNNYTENIKIPNLAVMESLSTSRYNALFREIMHISPSEYIAKMRIHAAEERLSTTDLTCAEIAELSGYKDSHFFSRIFKKHTGKSPSEYRQGGNHGQSSK